MTLKTILVPTDFSQSSAAALRYARQLADAFQATIHLIHVVQDPLAQSWAVETYGTLPADILSQMEAGARRDLEKALPEADRKAYHAVVAVPVGSPFDQIIEYSKTHNIDLIIMGTHGRGALAHAILGSVAERVVRFAPCPVLTVREK